MMHLRSSLKNFLTLLFLVATTVNVAAQQGQDPQNRGTSGNVMNQYVDELGLGIIANGFMMEDAIDPDTYQLGPMDALTITLRGSVPVIMRGVVVNPMGEVVLPTIGNINLRDLTITEARVRIAEHAARYYRFDQLSVTLDVPKPVAVHLTGEAPRPGLQYVPASTRVDRVVLSNIFTAASARNVAVTSDNNGGSGAESQMAIPAVSGITPATPFNLANLQKEFDLGDNRLHHYSLRNVTIEHRDGSRSSADIIGYFYSGDLELNPMLKNGDRVILEGRNQSNARVSVSGMVRRPFESEFRKGDTISKLIRMAGGFNEYANMERVRVLHGGSVQIVDAADFDSFVLEPDARLIIDRATRSRSNHSAWVVGEVLNPGIYPIVEGVTTVQDLIEMAGGLTEDALLNGTFIDRNSVWAERMLEQPDYDWSLGLIHRTSEVYMESVNSMYLERAGSLSLVPIDLNNSRKSNEIKVTDNDRLIIPKDRKTVTVIGQASNTGYYPFVQGASVQHYIDQAGGYTAAADKNRIFVIKAGSMVWQRFEDTTVESGDMIYVDRIPRETFVSARQFELTKIQQRNSTAQVIISGIAAIAGIITTILVINQR